MGLPATMKRAAAPAVISSKAFCCFWSQPFNRLRNWAVSLSTWGASAAAERSRAAVMRNLPVNPPAIYLHGDSGGVEENSQPFQALRRGVSYSLHAFSSARGRTLPGVFGDSGHRPGTRQTAGYAGHL